MLSTIKSVTVIGSGFMGIQIAVRSALYGYPVRLFDIKNEAVEAAKKGIGENIDLLNALGALKEKPESILGRLSYWTDLASAVKDTDLVCETVPEKLELKREVFSQVEKLVSPSTIIATNSSSLPVSRIEETVMKKDRVVNIHFYAPVMKTYFVDVAGGSQTSQEVIDKVDQWLRSIECLPLKVKKECLGFVFNRVWRSVKRECLASWANGNADFRDIDRAWMIWTGMTTGPFAMMDAVGLDVVYDIEMEYYRDSNDPKDKPPDALKGMTDQGELGMKSGRGFYDWKDPEFAKPEFLKPH
jgi:3-hydroxybutyryl-CoA dehydrogenase